MRSLLRSFAVISALSLPLIAHASPVTYSGTLAITDGTTSIGGNSFSFTDPGTGTFFNPYDDSFDIQGVLHKGDTISLDVNFTAPGAGNGQISGQVFKGIFGGESIDWNIPASDQIDLSNGSIAYVDLGFLGYTAPTSLTSCGSRGSNNVCGSSDLYIYITDNDPAATAPEPSSLMLLGTGVLGAAGMLRRRLSL